MPSKLDKSRANLTKALTGLKAQVSASPTAGQAAHYSTVAEWLQVNDANLGTVRLASFPSAEIAANICSALNTSAANEAKITALVEALENLELSLAGCKLNPKKLGDAECTIDNAVEEIRATLALAKGGAK